MTKFMIFIPAYYAETTLLSVFDRIDNNTLAETSEILIQDDASIDHTFEIAQKIAKVCNKVTAIKNEKKLGYGGTQKKAYQYAIDKGYDIVVMIHGDGQLPPEYLANVIKPLIDKQADIVLGSRMLGNPINGGMPIYKFLGNRFLTWLMNFSLNQNLTDYHTGYVGITTQALKKIDFSRCKNGHEISAELLVKAIHEGLRIDEVSVPTSYESGSRSITWKTSMKYGIYVIKLLFSKDN